MRRGTKPIPTHLKLIAGNRGKRRLNDAEPKPAPLLSPEPPPELNADARIEWDRVFRQLVSSGIVSVVDRGTLAAYCQAYGRWLQAERAFADMARRDPVMVGLMIKTKQGNVIQNPLVGTANKAMSDMVRYAAELGMTPSARSRVRASHDQYEDPAEQFFGS